MKHWTKGLGTSYAAYNNEPVYVLKEADRVLSVILLVNGMIRVGEECDTYFSKEYTKDEAIALFKEMVDVLEGIK